MNNVTTYEQYLEQYGSLTYTFKGSSMNPMLKQGRDLFTVKAKTAERCRKYDVVLYRRPPNQYVLHRIVEVREKDYVILGDNCVNKEYGIRDEDIIGVLTGFVRAGKTYSVTDPSYRLYVRVWCRLFYLRMVALKAKSLLRRLKRKNREENGKNEILINPVRDFVYLTVCALRNQKPDVTLLGDVDWNALYRMAKRHSMTAMRERLNVSKTDFGPCGRSTLRNEKTD